MPTSFANNWCEFHENLVDILYNRHNEIFSSSKKFTILDSENTHFSQFENIFQKCVAKMHESLLVIVNSFLFH